jgi:hypothetical protein
MTADIPGPGALHGAPRSIDAVRSDAASLRALAIAAGLCWSALFVTLGPHHHLQEYADGSLFSYSVAVGDAWAFHWHNISGRLTVYLFCHLPAEAYVALTRNAHGGVALYGVVFFSFPLIGLVLTYAADRSRERTLFSHACVSTACLCPLVFGFPTEVWVTHALFWPTLSLCHYARGNFAGALAVFIALLALVFTHAGALIFAVVILGTLVLRGTRDPAFVRAGAALLLVLAIWATVKATCRPDDYIAAVLFAAALHVFDPIILAGDLALLLFAMLAGYGAVLVLLRRLTPANAHACAASIVAVALLAYWIEYDHALHAANRYYLRTAILVMTPLIGILAAFHALTTDGRLARAPSVVLPLMTKLASGAAPRAAAGAILLVMLVHAVETEKFVSAWSDYRAALRTLALGSVSDLALGDAAFVSSLRIGPSLNRLGWSSTTPYLSVLVAPGFAPARLVIDPATDYFWLSCRTATLSQQADRAVPVESRRLIRRHACLHR